jgi:hypothetical protein
MRIPSQSPALAMTMSLGVTIAARAQEPTPMYCLFELFFSKIVLKDFSS